MFSSTLKKSALRFGYRLIRFSAPPTTKNNLSYSRILPYAVYSPWLDEPDFMAVFNHISGKFTLVDIYRCYELWHLIGQTDKLAPEADILEVGVWRGGTSVVMAKRLQLLKSSSTIYSADTFSGVVKSSSVDHSYSDGEHADTSLELFQSLYNGLKLTNIKPLKGIFPEQTSTHISASTQFKLCHIDVDVYLSARDVQDWIWSKLVVGGVIVFDDYGFGSTDGITRFVNEQKNQSDRLIFQNLNGHAVIVKLK